MRPLADFIVNPVRDEFASPTVTHLLEVYEKRLVPQMSHRDPDGSVVLAPVFERGPLVGWAIYLPWTSNPVPMNRNGKSTNWRATAAAERMVRQVAYSVAHNRIPPQPRIRVGLEWQVVVHRTRDEDNLVKLMKHLTDGIRIAGVVPDDNKTYVDREFPEIHYSPKGPRRPQAHFLFRIERVAD